ncbi:MAG: hypothetical protein ACI4OD_07455 [Selenomonas sp.]
MPLQNETTPQDLAAFFVALRQAPPVPSVPPAEGETNGAHIYEAVKKELDEAADGE